MYRKEPKNSIMEVYNPYVKIVGKDCDRQGSKAQGGKADNSDGCKLTCGRKNCGGIRIKPGILKGNRSRR